MATFTPLEERDKDELVRVYGLPRIARIVPIPEGSVNSNYRLEAEDGRAFFVRVFEEQGADGAEYDAALLSHLSARGVPTPCPLRRLDGRAVSTVAGKPASVFPFVRGTPSCQRAVDEERARSVGRALARIHVAGEGFPIRRESRFRIEDLAQRMPTIAAASDPAIARMAVVVPEELARWSERREPRVPEGIIHGDLFRDNVLFAATEGEDRAVVAALLDFESASDGRFVYDLAVTLLAWCFGDALDLALLRAIVSGYEEVRRLEPEERRGLRAELAIAALRFTTTRITDYALRTGIGARVVKDWRRFHRRFETVTTLDVVL